MLKLLKKQKLYVKIATICLAIIVVMGIAFLIYAGDYYKAGAQAKDMFHHAENIEVTKDFITVKATKETNSNKGFIFYPGGKVEYIAYLPLLEKLSEQGINCYLVKMPFNLAVFGKDKADKVIKNNKEIDTWYIGGHSLGGAIASSYAEKHQKKISGLILLGAYIYGDYPTDNAVILYGSEDRVLSRNKVKDDKHVYEISGGNHAGFGDYGKQKGDGKATITSEKQQEIAVEYIIQFIRDMEK